MGFVVVVIVFGGVWRVCNVHMCPQWIWSWSDASMLAMVLRGKTLSRRHFAIQQVVGINLFGFECVCIVYCAVFANSTRIRRGRQNLME